MKAIFQKNNSIYKLHFYIEYKSYIIEVKLENSNQQECYFLAIDKETGIPLFESTFFDIYHIPKLERKVYEMDERKFPISFYAELDENTENSIKQQFDMKEKEINHALKLKYFPYKITIFHYYTLAYKNKTISEEQYNISIPFFIENKTDHNLDYLYSKPIEYNMDKFDFFKHLNFSSSDYNQLRLCIRYNPYFFLNNFDLFKEMIDKDAIIYFFKYYNFFNLDILQSKEFELIFNYFIEILIVNPIEFHNDHYFLNLFSQFTTNKYYEEEYKTKANLFYFFVRKLLKINLSEKTLSSLIEIYLSFNKNLLYKVINYEELFIRQINFVHVINKWKDKKLIVKFSKDYLGANYEFIFLFSAYQNNIISIEHFNTLIENLEPKKYNQIKVLIEKHLFKENLKNF